MNVQHRSTVLVGLLTVAIVLSGKSIAADVDWNGWSFDYTTNENSHGLVLKDVNFNGKKVLAKASMPVMRVEYENDICGPFTDILGIGSLEPANFGAPDSACNGQAVCRRTFMQDGRQMLEIGSNWQIAEYQIYQTYYFSEDGYIDARVYSRGLQCTVDHSHHAHWLFDFDIGDAENDRILRGADDIQALEFNDLTAQTPYWTIEDSVTGDSVTLTPSDDDGTPDDFSQWDFAARKYHASELGKWRWGARGEIGNLFNEPPESIENQDLVIWYVSHLPHSAAEGPSIWHASGPRIQVATTSVVPDPDPEPEPDPDPDPTNLLVNGGFESDLNGWSNCANADNLVISADANEGARALSISDGGCLYQELAVNAGEEFVLTCDATRSGSLWSIVEFSFLDEQYNNLQSEIRQVASSGEYSTHRMSGTAPADTAFALALLYSEDQTLVDNCILSIAADAPEQPDPVPPVDGNILVNGGFESNLNNWTNCASADLTSVVDEADSGDRALQVVDGGCIYQEFSVTPGVQYSMNCRARRNVDEQYTSVSLMLMNANYNALENTELPVNGPNYANYSATLVAPASSEFGSVIVYSENPAVFDNCIVVEN